MSNELVLSVSGMTCAQCSTLIERGTVDALSRASCSKIHVSVSPVTGIATATYNGPKVDAEGVVKAIDDLGYEAKVLKSTASKDLEEIEAKFEIEGMTCTTCSGTIERAVKSLPHVKSVVVTLATNTATVVYEPVDGMSASTIVATVESVGFGASLLHEHVVVVNNAANKRHSHVLLLPQELAADETSSGVLDKVAEVERRLERLIGRERFTLDTSMASTESSVVVSVDDDTLVGPRILVALFANVGLSVTVSSMGGFMLAGRLMKQQAAELMRQQRKLWVALALTIPIVCITMIFPASSPTLRTFFQTTMVFPGLSLKSLLLLLLATPIEFWVGWMFHKKAWLSMRAGTLGMDFLVSTGTLAAYVFSAIGILRGIVSGVDRSKDVEYFETSAVLITVVILGKYLELYAKGATAIAIHKLNGLKSKTARLVTAADASLSASLSSSATAAAEPQEGVAVDGAGAGDEERIIDASLLQVGDVVRLVAGEQVPADGTLQTEYVGVDESMMTGESRMVSKLAGTSLFGGTTVVEGSGLMLVTACGDDSALGKIVGIVQDAQVSRPPIQELADVIASYFVPAVATVSLTTFLVWTVAYWTGAVPHSWLVHADGDPTLFAFLFALAVWVSACPCAFGLATPTAVLVSTGVAASNGILIRRGSALQFAAEATAIAFDKTGTLTMGNTKVSDFEMVPVDNEEPVPDSVGVEASLRSRRRRQDVLRLLLAAEVRSSHPISKGITEYCRQELKLARSPQSPKSDDADADAEADVDEDQQHHIVTVPGKGIRMDPASAQTQAEGAEVKESDGGNADDDVEGPITGDTVLVGNEALLEERSVVVPRTVRARADALRSDGKVVVYMSHGRSVCAVVALSDTVRPEAASVLHYLQSHMRLECYMVTGDNRRTALAVARRLGLPADDEHVRASAKPEDKQAFLKSLQARDPNARVCFVGDGTNDSPALAQAHVGVAMASGTEIAVEAGDIVLCHAHLQSLVVALDLSKKTYRRILLNYVWAVVYNILLVPLAAGVLFPSFRVALDPMLAGLAMSLSSVSIVVSSLLLGCYSVPNMRVVAVDTSKHCHCPKPPSAFPDLDPTYDASSLWQWGRPWTSLVRWTGRSWHRLLHGGLSSPSSSSSVGGRSVATAAEAHDNGDGDGDEHTASTLEMPTVMVGNVHRDGGSGGRAGHSSIPVRPREPHPCLCEDCNCGSTDCQCPVSRAAAVVSSTAVHNA